MMNTWLKMCYGKIEDLDRLLNKLVEFDDDIHHEFDKLLGEINSFNYKLDNIVHPEDSRGFDLVDDAEADEMYEAWEQLSELRKELDRYERVFERVRRELHSVYRLK